MSKRIPPGMRRVVKVEKGWSIWIQPSQKDARFSDHYTADWNLIEQFALDAIRQHKELKIIVNATARVWQEDEAIP